MKKVFVAIGLLFIFTTTAFAQETNEDAQVLAKKELHSLLEEIDLDNQIVIGLNDLLIFKHEANAKFPKDKKEVAKTIASKLEGTLTPAQFTKVKRNKALFKDLLY